MNNYKEKFSLEEREKLEHYAPLSISTYLIGRSMGKSESQVCDEYRRRGGRKKYKANNPVSPPKMGCNTNVEKNKRGRKKKEFSFEEREKILSLRRGGMSQQMLAFVMRAGRKRIRALVDEFEYGDMK